MKTITLSAKAVTDDLKTEFGNIAPAFLPLQNKTLLEWHTEFPNSDNYLTIDHNYKFSNFENSVVVRSQSKIIKVKKIGNILSAFSNVFNHLSFVEKLDPEECFRIIYGDTIISPWPKFSVSEEFFTTMPIPDSGSWFEINKTGYTFGGLFQFTLKTLKKLIDKTENSHEFLEKIAANTNLKSIYLEQTLDFGRSHTYHQNKLKFSTARVFNETRVDKYKFTKSGPTEKISAEYDWFKSIPRNIIAYTPNVYSLDDFDVNSSYDLETLYESNLAEILIHGKLSQFTVNEVFQELSDFLDHCWTHTNNTHLNLQVLFNQKLENRFKSEKMHDFLIKAELENQGKALLSKYLSANQRLLRDNDRVCVSHGDLCFSNVLFNFKKKTIKVIDPRGLSLVENTPSILGPKFYDLIKLGHSAVYEYDVILRNVHSSSGGMLNGSEEIRRLYWDIVDRANENYSQDEIKLGIGNLFFTMIPLHYDNFDRQLIFFNLSRKILGEIKCK